MLYGILVYLVAGIYFGELLVASERRIRGWNYAAWVFLWIIMLPFAKVLVFIQERKESK